LLDQLGNNFNYTSDEENKLREEADVAKDILRQFDAYKSGDE